MSSESTRRGTILETDTKGEGLLNTEGDKIKRCWFILKYFCLRMSFYSSWHVSFLTVDVAEVEVSVDQRGSVVEVLGHVIQPVGLHALDPLVAVLNPQRHLDSVVLHLALSDRRVVVQSEQLHPCWHTTENKKNKKNLGFKLCQGCDNTNVSSVEVSSFTAWFLNCCCSLATVQSVVWLRLLEHFASLQQPGVVRNGSVNGWLRDSRVLVSNI